MHQLKTALLQIETAGDTEDNLIKGLEACREAKKQNADIALFPELWSSGYQIPEEIGELKHMAVSADSDFVRSFGELAAELDMAVAVTYLEQHEPRPRNTVTLFDRHGRNVLTYAKVHTCGTSHLSKSTD